jgi:hypothetical protein
VRRWGTCESMGTVRETLDSYGSRRSAVATGRDNRGILSVKRTILGGGSGRPEDGRGSLGHAATLRFPSPLIEPDVRISRIRLSDWLHHEAHERITDRKRHVRGVLFLRPTTQLSLKDPDHSRCLQAHRQSPSHRVLRKHTRSQGPFLRRHYPASTVVRPCPTPACAAARSDVEAATLTPNGSPPITRTTFPTCRAHYPGGSSGCACRLLPRSRHPHCHCRGLLRLHSRYGPPDRSAAHRRPLS